MVRACALLGLLVGLLPASLGGQARIETILPAGADVTLTRLGADGPEEATEGMELAPGDLLGAAQDGVSLGLTCAGPEGTNTYLVTGPFRLLIDVPTVASCHVNLLSGLTEVAAEAPTETTAGGVTLGSTGTQYAVELRRRGTALVFTCFVYDDWVLVTSYPDLRATAGQKMVWSGTTAVTVDANTRADLSRSAATYARFDVAHMGSDEESAEARAALRRLTDLHLDVLAHPADTLRRVALAKEQLRVGAYGRAMYNLKRVDVQDSVRLRRHALDPGLASTAAATSGRSPAERVRILRAAPAPATPATTDGDLRLIAEGRVDEAISNLETRVSGGRAGSRDEFALARAYAVLGDDVRVRAHAGRALVLHAGDGELSAAELRELGELIGRRD